MSRLRQLLPPCPAQQRYHDPFQIFLSWNRWMDFASFLASALNTLSSAFSSGWAPWPWTSPTSSQTYSRFWPFTWKSLCWDCWSCWRKSQRIMGRPWLKSQYSLRWSMVCWFHKNEHFLVNLFFLQHENMFAGGSTFGDHCYCHYGQLWLLWMDLAQHWQIFLLHRVVRVHNSEKTLRALRMLSCTWTLSQVPLVGLSFPRKSSFFKKADFGILSLSLSLSHLNI